MELPQVALPPPKERKYVSQSIASELDKVKDRVQNKEWDYVTVVAGLPGCLSKDTLIQTSNGDMTVGELSNKTIYLNSLDLETGEVEKGKGFVFPTGRKIVYEIETIDGRKVKATKDHTFFIKKEDKIVEIKLEDLKEGDELICED